ncbi:MAG: type II toxin-antitoxin system VapC family toxin [Desulfobacterales bacterium]
MSFHIDPCVWSELVRPKPHRRLVGWIEAQDESRLYLSVITIGEIQKGIAKLPASSRKERLVTWLDEELVERFKGKILSIDLTVARQWGHIQAACELRGLKMPVVDAFIAAIALLSDMTIVTRNEQDMAASGAKIFNPWMA